MQHLVMFSGGSGSWATARRVVDKYGPENTRLIFADTKIEDEDLYRFVVETDQVLKEVLVTLADGRDPWQVFFDERFLGYSRVDPCSKILKRNLIRSWLEKNYPDPETVTIYLGIDWSEEHRYTKALPHWEPYTVKAPLCEPPLLDLSLIHISEPTRPY